MDHGYCTKPDECLCRQGYSGDTCDDCITHPGCPATGRCVHPWDCICPDQENTNKFCFLGQRSDFIKTSTGKEGVNATLPVGLVIKFFLKMFLSRLSSKSLLLVVGATREVLLLENYYNS